jgi:isoleucyl-tRNA synthetase
MNNKKKYINSIENNKNFIESEESILKFWNENKIFEKTLEKTKDCKNYIFYDGPPFANGLPHYGHLLTSCAKDVIGRFQTMNNRYVARRFGWDCHGLPAEMAAEKELKVSGRKAIEDFGIEKFNNHCKTDVMKFSNEWKKYIERIGRWVDMENAYKTMDIEFMESILWAFKNLYDQGLVYRQMKVMPYSWACQTPLSNFETRLDNSYREKESKSIIVRFELNKEDFLERIINSGCVDLEAEKINKIYILVWTTTPWTLPSNLALAISSKFEYDIIFDKNSKDISICLGSKKFFKDLKIDEEKLSEEYMVYKVLGENLLNISYKPLFLYFSKICSKNCFKIYHGDFVSDSDGTGVVHIAPGFGEDDFELCKKFDIGIFDSEEECLEFQEEKDLYSLKKLFPAVPVDDDGKFLPIVKDYASMHVFESNDEIIKYLKTSGNWIKTSQYLHQYPHCWRTDTPIIYKAMPSYYIEVSKFRERLSELNSKINWIPEGVKDGIFGNWLKEAKDWAISRNRFFGTPIPVWISDDENYPCVKVFGSVLELEEFFGPYYSKVNNGEKLKITDLHRPFIDELIAPNPNDPSSKSFLRRIPDVFDCWFESGAMSFAEVHYPFNKGSYNENFPLYNSKDFNPKIHKPNRLPADFIVEYTAQTRGWFYTLVVLSTLIFDDIPFKNCICHGVILDEKGQKLSKRLGNYIDPIEAMNEYGADALRYVMLSSPVMSGGELLIDKEGRMLSEAIKIIQKPIWSALNFFILYAHEDQPELSLYDLNDLAIWTSKLSNKASLSNGCQVEALEYDFFIVFKAFELSHEIYKSLSEYKIMNSYLALRNFIDDLNNFYIRANRDRFWIGGMNDDKKRAFNALYSALYYLCIAIAPIMPFFAENVFSKIQDSNLESIHMQEFTFIDDDNISKKAFNEIFEKNKDFLDSMNILKKIFYHGRSIRDDKLCLRIRQPLRSAKIITNLNIFDKNFNFFKKEIERELNIHNLELINEDNEKSLVQKYFSRKIKINTRLLGPKLGKDIQKIKSLLDSCNFELIENYSKLKIGDFIFDKNKNEFFSEINILKEFEKNLSVAFDEFGSYVLIYLDDYIDENLSFEGMMRDLVRSVQDGRKTMFEIADRIELYVWFKNKDLSLVCDKFKDYICEQTLSEKFEYMHFDDDESMKKFEKSLTDKGLCIFGYNVHNTFKKEDIDIRLSFRIYNKFK